LKHAEYFWKGFFEALNTEFKQISELQGISGIKHQIIGIGIDREKKRIIIAQNEQDPRILAMAQSDIQATIKDYNILMVRPVPINLSQTFLHLSNFLGTFNFMDKDLINISNSVEKDEYGNIKSISNDLPFLQSLIPQINTIQKTGLSLVPIYKELVQQLSYLKFLTKIQDEKTFLSGVNFQELIGFNPVIYDNNAGVCPITLYDFSEKEIELFIENKNSENNLNILKAHNIKQFFYPPIDSLALGLIEKSTYKEKELIEKINSVPKSGHPYGENEIVEFKKIDNLVEALKDKGLVVNGEVNLGITKEGEEKRLQVKFSPRESIFKRLSNIFSVKIDISFNLTEFLKK